MSGRRRSPRKRRPDLSQHFLREASAGRFVQATSIAPNDLVVEIGPGRGALTRPLSRRARRLIAVELDSYLADKLRTALPAVEIVAGDFLDYELPRGRYTVVGNVPFSRSTEILRKLSRAENPPRDCWLVVQRELGQRLCGRPYEDESIASLRLKPEWHSEIVDRLSRTEFEPPPSVDAVVIHLCHRGRRLVSRSDSGRFVDLIESGFQFPQSVGRGLRRILSRTQLSRLSRELRFDAAGRAGSLSFEQWLAIFRFVSRAPAHDQSRTGNRSGGGRRTSRRSHQRDLQAGRR